MGPFDDSARERLSALADGELAGAEPAELCSAWAADAEARAHWHAWHLIGDVLRSEDLASDPRGDRDFCAAVRARLASEAVVLAPVASSRPAAASAGFASRPGRWMAGGAVAAGFVLAAGTFAVVRTGEVPATERVALGNGIAVDRVAARATPGGAAAAPVAVVADSQLIRDARLDRYLLAHKQFAGTSALGVPSVFLRSATVDPGSR